MTKITDIQDLPGLVLYITAHHAALGEYPTAVALPPKIYSEVLSEQLEARGGWPWVHESCIALSPRFLFMGVVIVPTE